MLNTELLVENFECKFYHKLLGLKHIPVRVDNVEITYKEEDVIDTKLYKLEILKNDTTGRKYIVVDHKRYGLEWFCEY